MSHTTRRILFAFLAILAWSLAVHGAATAQTPPAASGPLLHITQANERVEMIVNTSRIITLDKSIPQVQVNNPDIIAAKPLSPNHVQISAKKAGVTQVNLWAQTQPGAEGQQVYTIDVIVIGDARELSMLLESEFPLASIKVRPVSNGVLISGYVDRPQDVDHIKALAEEYYPKVITNITVGGVQQVLLHLKVYEVSRTRLRSLGLDWAYISNGGFIATGISEILSAGASGVNSGLRAPTGNATMSFKLVGDDSSFFGILEALRRDDLIKLMSEPTLVTYSGRPAYFHVGGEIPYLVSQGFGAIQVDWKDYGTQVDFVPVVLGNGRIRLEIRPQVSEFDDTRSSFEGIPAFKRSEVDTGVELEAGQTLAIAGLVQRRTETRKRGLPLIADVPYLGAAFSSKKEETNEIETLVFVTPELVEGMAPHEVPQCPPGTRTASPNDWDFYLKGHIEVPNPCPPCNGPACGPGAAQGMVPGARESVPLPPGVGPQVPPVKPEAKPGFPMRPATAGASRASGTSVRYNSSRPQARTAASGAAANPTGLPGFGGPIGYDVDE